MTRKLPAYEDLMSYWGPTLARLDKADLGELEQCFVPASRGGRTSGICFACGFIRPLDKAHIKARVCGGSDDVDNIHLLCKLCHQASEGMEGERYWQWFKSQDMLSSTLAMLLTARPDALDLFRSHR